MKLRPGSKVIEDHLKQLEPFVQGNGVGDLEPMELRDVNIHLQIGAIMYEQAIYHEAIDEFRLVLAEEENRDLRLLIARIYEMFGRMDKATQEIETYRRLSGVPDTVDILLNLARLYGLDEKMEESVSLLKKAVSMQPQNDRLFHSLALAQMSVKENDQAIQSIQKAIEIDSQKDAYFFELGALYERVGDYQRAIKAMEQTLAINPNHSNAHNFIGYLYAVEGVKLEKALDHLKIALTIQPRNGYFLDSLGWIYYKKGDLDEALKHIKKAMIYTSPDPVLYDHLGDVHYSMKNFSEAKRAWQTSLSLTMKKLEDPTGELPDPAELKNKIEKTRKFLGSDL